MAANVGTAYVTIVPTMRGAASTITSELEGAMSSVDGESAGSKAASGFSSGLSAKVGAIAGVVSAVASKAFDVIADSLDSAVSRVDTLNNYPVVMQSIGYSAEEAAASIETLSDGIDGLPTSLDSIVSITQNLAPMCDGLDEASELAIALNDAMLAGGQGTEVANAAITQFTQMLAAGKVDMAAWNSVVTAAPGQMDQLAKSMLGATATQQDLYSALQDGTISMDEFCDAIVELDKNGGDGFASFAEQAQASTQGIATSMENAKTAVVKNLANIIDAFNQNGEISGFFDGLKQGINDVGTLITDEFVPVVQGAMEFVGTLGDTISQAFNDAFNSNGEFDTFMQGLSDAASGLADVVMNQLVPAFQSGLLAVIPQIISALPTVIDLLSQLSPVIAGVAAAFAGFKVGSFVEDIVGAVSSLGGLSGVLSSLSGIASAAGAGLSNLWTVLSANPIGVVLAAIAALVTAFITLYNTNEEFRNAVDSAWSTISAVIQPVIETLVTFFTVTVPNAIQTAIEWFQNLPENVSTAIENAKTAVAEWVTNLGEQAAQVGTNFVDAVGSFFSNLPYNIGLALGTAIGTIANWVISLGEQAVQVGTSFVDTVINFFANLPSNIANFLSSVISNVASWVSNMASNAMQAGSQFLQNVGSFIQNLPSNVASWLTSTISKVISFVTDMGNKAKQAGTDFLNNIVNTIKTIPDKVFSIGQDIVNGVWNGIQSMWSTFTSNVSSFFSGIVDGVKSTLGIASPSKVFAEIGEYTMQGMANGIKDGAGAASDAMRDAMEDVYKVASGELAVSASATLDNARAVGATLSVSLDGAAGTKTEIVQNFSTRVVRADEDLYAVAPTMYRAARREARMVSA